MNSPDNAREWEPSSRDLKRISEDFAGVPIQEIEAKIDEIIAEGRERNREARFAVIDRMRAAFADVSLEEIEREAERTVTEARERIQQRTVGPAHRSA